MEVEDIYENDKIHNFKGPQGPQIWSESKDEAQKQRGRVCLVLMTVSLGLICVLLLVFIIWQNISITAERDLLKRYERQFNHTINSLQTNYTDLSTEEERLKKSLSSLSQKNQECETRVNDLASENRHLQSNFNYWSWKKPELETRVNDISAENSKLRRQIESLSQKKLELETELRKLSEQGIGRFFMSNEAKSWSESRQYCRNCGGDLVMIKTEEKQMFISSLVKEFVWIGLSDTEREGTMTWVDNSPLNQGFWERNEPNDAGGNEDCIELNPRKSVLNNWNDIPCSAMRKSVCER